MSTFFFSFFGNINQTISQNSCQPKYEKSNCNLSSFIEIGANITKEMNWHSMYLS